jgi:hypothetical protein
MTLSHQQNGRRSDQEDMMTSSVYANRDNLCL